MKEIIDKISSYNLFNYLLPGILFVIFAERFTSYSLVQENLIIGAFLYYFIGLIISRVGSLVIEPFLKNVSLLKFSKYSDFISASRKDPKIEILSRENNMYRTIVSMLVLLFLLRGCNIIEVSYPSIGQYSPYVLGLLLLILFIYAYRKQTEYITKRVNASSKQ